MRPQTYEGAKMIAKYLKREFRSRGEPVRLADSFEAVASGMGFRHWHDVASDFRPERVAPWSDDHAAAALTRRCAVGPAAVAEVLEEVGRRFRHWG